MLTLLVLALAGQLGDLHYNNAAWHIEQKDNVYVISERDGESEADLFTATIQSEDAGDCSPEAMAKALFSERTPVSRTIDKGTFKVHISMAFLGCRNARPPSVAACTRYKGRLYRFDQPIAGCEGGPGFTGAIEFLESLSAQ